MLNIVGILNKESTVLITSCVFLVPPLQVVLVMLTPYRVWEAEWGCEQDLLTTPLPFVH